MAAPIKNKTELFNLILLNSDKIKSYGVKELGVFGSFARNEATEKSDVDFFMDFDPQYKTLKNFVGLSNYLQALLGRKIEIVTPQSLNKYTGKYITQQVENVPFAA